MPNKFPSAGLQTSIDRWQLGFAPIFVIVAALALAALAGGGYMFSQKGGSPLSKISEAVSSVAPLNPNCEYNDPDLCKFLNNWKTIKDYSVKSVSTAKEGNSESLFEISGEDKFHMMSSENGKELMNMITIGKTNYTKDYSDNKWWKQVQKEIKNEYVDDMKLDFDEDTKEGQKPEQKTQYKQVGKEACGNLQCFKYEVMDPGVTESQEFILFDDKEYRLRKNISIAKDGSRYESEISYSGVSIKEPSPTKDLPADQVVMPGGGTYDTKQMDQETKAAQQEAERYMREYQNQAPAEDYSDEGY
jgi:hypothetical protein